MSNGGQSARSIQDFACMSQERKTGGRGGVGVGVMEARDHVTKAVLQRGA